MGARVTHWTDLGDGNVQVYARTDAGSVVSIVAGRQRLGSAELGAMLDLAGRRADDDATALAARVGRSDQDET